VEDTGYPLSKTPLRVILLIDIYSKTEQVDISADEIRRRLIEETLNDDNLTFNKSL